MKTREEIEAIATEYATQMKNLLGNQLNMVILYGSYARGDYEEGSDVDIMVLVDAPQTQIATIRGKVQDIAFELGWRNQIILSTVIESIEIFNRYRDASGFFKNVANEGVKISA